MSAFHRQSSALLLLLTIFLAAQLLALAHETAHSFGADTDQCSICLRAGQYKSSAVDTAATTAKIFPRASSNRLTLPVQADPFPLIRRARGPPSPELS